MGIVFVRLLSFLWSCVVLFLSVLLVTPLSFLCCVHTSIRGKGSVKDGSKGRSKHDGPDEDDELHVHVDGPTMEMVRSHCTALVWSDALRLGTNSHADDK